MWYIPTVIKHSLYKRNQIWWVDFYIEGKRYQKSTRATTKTEAERIALLIMEKALRDEYGKSDHSLFDLINRYIAHIKLNNKSWRSKETHLKAFARFMKDKNLSAITLQDCQNFHKQLIEKPITKTKYMKRSTVNRYFSTIKHMFNRAIDWNMIQKNPGQRIKQHTESPRLRFYSQKEIERLDFNRH